MAKTAAGVAGGAAAVGLFIILVSSSTFVAAAAGGKGEEKMYVEGKVYCDPCRIEFPVKISTMMAGAGVQLQCRSRENGRVTYAVDGETDKTGTYRLAVVGDHEEDICEVRLMGSPQPDCKDMFKFIDRARVLLTDDIQSGMLQSTRYANPIGYMKSTTDPRCNTILQAMGMTLAQAQTKFLI